MRLKSKHFWFGTVLLVLLSFDVFLACASEHIGLRPNGREKAGESAVVGLSEEGMHRFVASLRQPEFLATTQRDPFPLPFSMPLHELRVDSSHAAWTGHSSPSNHEPGLPQVSKHILLCVWLI